MSDTRTIDVLNRLLAILYRSLPMYLTDAVPWVHHGDEKAATTLKHVVSDQRQFVARIIATIQDRGGGFDLGGYPMDFTDTHGLSLDFMLRDLIRWQRFDIHRIEPLVDELGADRSARELVQEALGSARAHLEAFQELAAQPSL